MKKSTLSIIVVSVIICIIVLTFCFSSLLNRNDNKEDNSLSTTVKELLRKDYLATNFVFGKPITDDANIVIQDIKYNIVNNKDLTNIADLQNLIFDIYTDDVLETYFLDLDKYNKYVEFQNNLYVNINSKCSVSDFDKNVKIVEYNGKDVVVKNNNKKIKITKENGKYKLLESAYLCENK